MYLICIVSFIYMYITFMTRYTLLKPSAMLFAAKKGKKSHPLKFKVGLGKVIRGVRHVSYYSQIPLGVVSLYCSVR